MADQVCSEFSSFLRMLANENDLLYVDDAQRLIRVVKSAAEAEIGRHERRVRLTVLANLLYDLITKLEEDETRELRYRIPLAVREMSLVTLDGIVQLSHLGNFELAVRRFERPENTRRLKMSDTPPA